MSKTKVHVLIPFTVGVACGTQGHYKCANIREQVTCKKCRKSDYFKALPNRKKL